MEETKSTGKTAYAVPGEIYTQKDAEKEYLCLRGNTEHYPRALFLQMGTGFVFETDSPEIFGSGKIYFENHIGGHQYGEEIADKIYGEKYFMDSYPWEE